MSLNMEADMTTKCLKRWLVFGCLGCAGCQSTYQLKYTCNPLPGHRIEATIHVDRIDKPKESTK
jgi:hypothetical protein